MKKVKLPLTMANDVAVRTLDELKANWDLKKILLYYSDGRLANWLRDRYHDELAQQVENLNCHDTELQEQLSAVFGMKIEESRHVDMDSLIDSQSRSALLRQYTSDDDILKNIDFVAFNQEELDILVKKGAETIYLCGNKFRVSFDSCVKKYIGIVSATVLVNGIEVTSVSEMSLEFENVEFDAETGDGMSLIGDLYESGRCGHKNREKAFVWFTKSAENGSSKGEYNLGRCFYHGIGCAEDKNKAFELFSKSAEQGFARSQSYLANCYHFGHGVDKDNGKAFEWMFKAANAGDVISKRVLGFYYLDGIGCEKDEKKAVNYLEDAAVKGDFHAQYQMGICYAKGIGRIQNFENMLNWYRKAVETDVRAFMQTTFKNCNKKYESEKWKKHLLKIIDAVMTMWKKGLFSGETIGGKHLCLGKIKESLTKNVMKYYGDEYGLVKNQVWFVDDDTWVKASGSAGFAMDLFGIVTSRKERIWFSDITDIFFSKKTGIMATNSDIAVFVRDKSGKEREIYVITFSSNHYKAIDSYDKKEAVSFGELNQMFDLLSEALKE